MNKTLSLTAALLFATLPVQAQRMGSVNNDAPQCASSITFKDKASIKIEYQANAWAKGKTMTAAADKEKGGRARNMINQTAEQQPLGTFEVSADITIGDKTVAAGKYSLYFTIDDNANWNMNLAPQSGDKIVVALKLEESKEEHKRVCIQLHAGENSKSADLEIAFGNKHCSMTVAKSAGSAKDAGHEKGAGHDKGAEAGEGKKK